MKFLLDIPLVMLFATWVWGNDATYCVEHIFHFNIDCWTQLIVKGLGIAIILGSCFNKAPVMYNLYSSKSTAGMSLSSVYGEILVYMNATLYGILHRHPLTAYGENMALFAQSYIIMNFIWVYTKPKPISLYECSIVNLFISVYFVYILTSAPESYYYLLMTSIMPILLYSRGVQIYTTISCQHTGAQSIVTNTLNLVGGLVRIITTIKEVGYDIPILTSYTVSCTLNFIIFLQYFYYQSNTRKFLSELQTQTVTTTKAKKE